MSETREAEPRDDEFDDEPEEADMAHFRAVLNEMREMGLLAPRTLREDDYVIYANDYTPEPSDD